LVLTSTLPRWDEDSEPRFVLDLASAMSHRFEPVILAPMAEGTAPRERLNGIAVRRYRYAPFRRWERLASPGAIMPNLRRRPWLYILVPSFLLGQLIATVSLLRRERFEAVHCHWLIPQGLVLALASLFVKVPPILVSCHGADAFTLDSAPFRQLKTWILGRCDAISVVSREIRAKLEKTAGPQLPSAPVLIPMGVNLDHFSVPRARNAGRPVILCAGRLAAKKGVANLIEAVANPRIRRRQVALRIVGDGPLLDDLKQLARRRQVSDRVTFTGPLPHQRLAEEMRTSTLFCAPFVIAADGDREGMPTVLLEAASSGLPIITSEVGGCAELIMSGTSGWLLPPGDIESLIRAIEDALDHPDRARKFAVTAREQAKRFSWPVIAARHIAILDRLLRPEAEERRDAA
jgi:phosphatidylinositol alpha-1,6-mannosyltransferase